MAFSKKKRKAKMAYAYEHYNIMKVQLLMEPLDDTGHFET